MRECVKIGSSERRVEKAADGLTTGFSAVFCKNVRKSGRIYAESNVKGGVRYTQMRRKFRREGKHGKSGTCRVHWYKLLDSRNKRVNDRTNGREMVNVYKAYDARRICADVERECLFFNPPVVARSVLNTPGFLLFFCFLDFT